MNNDDIGEYIITSPERDHQFWAGAIVVGLLVAFLIFILGPVVIGLFKVVWGGWVDALTPGGIL